MVFEVSSLLDLLRKPTNQNSPQNDLCPTSLDVNRIAIKRKHLGDHEFEDFSILTEPTKCYGCKKMIWMFVFTPKKCRLCQLTFHGDCAKDMNSKCISAHISQQNNNQNHPTVQLGHKQETMVGSHIFIKTTFTKPTWCDHCGKVIKGIYKQGLKCGSDKERGCEETIHNDCEEKLQFRCKINALNKFEILKLLGVGSFSKVHLARFKPDDQLYAIKVVNKLDEDIGYDPSAARLEWQILEMGREFPFLVAGNCCFETKERLFYVMEYGPGRDLLHQLERRLESKEGPFSEQDTRFYAAEIIWALIYLHKHKIVYRDLKPENVILDSLGHCKLIDFGLSHKFSEPGNNISYTVKTSTFCGTRYYMSPEMIYGKLYDFSVDWWALGMLIYELVVGDLPFKFGNLKGSDELLIYKMILDDKIQIPSRLSNELRTLLEGLLEKDPEKRIGNQILEDKEQAVLKHPFFIMAQIPGQICTTDDLWQAINARTIRPPIVPGESIERFSPFDGYNYQDNEFEGFSSSRDSDLDTVLQNQLNLNSE